MKPYDKGETDKYEVQRKKYIDRGKVGTRFYLLNEISNQIRLPEEWNPTVLYKRGQKKKAKNHEDWKQELEIRQKPHWNNQNIVSDTDIEKRKTKKQ